MGIDRKFRLPRIWSNKELRKFAHMFEGSIVNISGWRDIDKEGNNYREYFINAHEYYISNYLAEFKGLQGYKNEFFLDLTLDLDDSLLNRFDVVFNHTTLEHIFDITKAFENLCLLTKDIIIIVIPFLQQMHGNYKDYWRFTPTVIKRLFDENGLSLLYLNFNDNKKTSIYIFAIGSKNPNKWKNKIPYKFNYLCKKSFLDEFQNNIGSNVIINPFLFRITQHFKKCIAKLKDKY